MKQQRTGRGPLRALAAAVVVMLAIGGADGLFAGSVDDTDGLAATRISQVSIAGARGDQVALVEWAVGRFEQAGLELPPVAVVVHQDFDGCDGNAGLYEIGAGRVHLCAIRDVDAKSARLITLHELGHAWSEQVLDDDTKAAFMDVRGLDVWTDHDVERWEWGAEHAAEVLSWGLIDEDVTIVRVGDAAPEQLAEAFEVLVGRGPLDRDRPHGFRLSDSEPVPEPHGDPSMWDRIRDLDLPESSRASSAAGLGYVVRGDWITVDGLTWEHLDGTTVTVSRPIGYVPRLTPLRSSAPRHSSSRRERRRQGPRASAAVILAVVLTFTVGAARARAGANTEHQITVAQPGQLALVEWSLGRFEQAGLELPPLNITVYDSRDGCDGHSGLYYLGTDRVAICVTDSFEATGARIIALHELGHAWAENVATQEARNGFLHARGLGVWRDSSVPRSRWGQEQAAEVLAWGLIDGETRVATIYDAGSHDLADAFEALTGASPLWSEAARSG